MKHTKHTKIFFWSSVILALLLLFSIRSCVKNARIIKEATGNSANASSDTVTKHWIDRWKTEHAEKVAIQGTLQSVRLTNVAELDEATMRIQAKQKQIEGLQKVVASVKGKFTTQVLHDTVRMWYAYQDSNITQTAIIQGDSVSVDYTVNVPINLIQYWKRGWFLGKKTHYVDGYSTNPYARITNLKSIRINAVEPGRFGIGPYIGVGYDGTGIKPSIGVCLSYSLFRF